MWKVLIVSRLRDTSFVTFVLGYDIAGFVETFVDSFSSNLFQSYTSFVAPAKKCSHHGRQSGGVVVLVKNTFLIFIRQVHSSTEIQYILEIDRELMGTESNVFLVNTYPNPPNIPFYDTTDFDNGIVVLEQCLLNIIEHNEDATFILSGDFYARTASSVLFYVDVSSSYDSNAGSLWHTEKDSDDYMLQTLVTGCG